MTNFGILMEIKGIEDPFKWSRDVVKKCQGGASSKGSTGIFYSPDKDKMVSKTSEKFNAYLNYVGGEDLDANKISQFGLTATAKISDKFGIGYDGTVKTVNPEIGSTESWFGSALYLNFDPSEKVGITARGEYFSDKKSVIGFGTSLFVYILELHSLQNFHIQMYHIFVLVVIREWFFLICESW